MSQIGIIVIGRNEGPRLHRCLQSVLGEDRVVVYVDSGSTDGSVEWARAHGAQVVELDQAKPFTAARGRNCGFEHLMQTHEHIEFVQFVDGDCELDPDWLDRGRAALTEQGDVAIVCGQLHERYPDWSIYNRLCDLEWNAGLGEIEMCGGVFMIRAKAFRDVGQFDETIVAGEEPDLCLRLRRQEHKIVRLDKQMARHDADMTSFRQWWQREVRNGYGSYDIAARHGFQPDAPFVSAVRRARGWGLYLPAAVLLTTMLGPWFGWRIALMLAGAVALIWPTQVLRVSWNMHKQGQPWKVALAYGWFTMVAKWPHLVGHHRYRRDHKTGQDTSVHFKADRVPPAPESVSPWQEDKKRYPPRPFLKEQSIWALGLYRLGRWSDRRTSGTLRWLGDRLYWLAFRFIETWTGISIPKMVQIGPGLRIWHFGNIFIHEQVRLGANCTLRQGVTIGNRHDGGPVPVVEDDVDFGAYAQVLGEVHIGRGAKIGAMSVVLDDVPAGATAVGNPARIIMPQQQKPADANTSETLNDKPSVTSDAEALTAHDAPLRDPQTLNPHS